VDVPNSYTQADEGKVVSQGDLVAQTAYPSTITTNNTYDTTNYNSVTIDVPTGGGGSAILSTHLNGGVASKHKEWVSITSSTVSSWYNLRSTSQLSGKNSFNIGDYYYIFSTSTGGTATFKKYVPSTDTWDTVSVGYNGTLSSGDAVVSDGTDYYLLTSFPYIWDSTQNKFVSTTFNYESLYPNLNAMRGAYVWIVNGIMYYSGVMEGAGSPYGTLVYDKPNNTWRVKTWNNAPADMEGRYIWTDGERIFYKYPYTDVFYELDLTTDTWNVKTFVDAPASFNPTALWTDGSDVYYSNTTATWKLNKSTDTWENLNWSVNCSGSYIGSNGHDIFSLSTWGTSKISLYKLRECTRTAHL
jgi:hypothetical protein